MRKRLNKRKRRKSKESEREQKMWRRSCGN